MSGHLRIRLVDSASVGDGSGEPVVIVDSRDTSEAALLSAARGSGFAVDLRLSGREREQFLDDLARLAVVEQPDRDSSVSLPSDHLVLLRALGEGRALTEVCRDLGLSRRTATRRLAEAKTILGVSTTTQAVLFAIRSDTGER